MQLDLLQQLVAINSVYPNEKELAEFLEQYLISLGFSVQRQEVEKDRFNLFATRGKKDPKGALCFFGHMDTVPPYGEWEQEDPFKAEIRDDKLYGLGSVDMKGGLFAILEAVKETDKDKYLKIVFCVDEENISAGAWKAVTNREFFEDIKVIIAAETGNIHPYDPEEKWVHLGRRGRCGIQVEVQGLSAHGAFPEKGINAITEAAIVIQSLESISTATHPIMGKSSLYATNIHSVDTSLSIPDFCSFQISLSLVPPETPLQALENIQEHIQKIALEKGLESKIEVSLVVRATPFASPYITDKENPAIKQTLEILQEITPKVSIDYGFSVADENVFANNTAAAVISIGPEGDNEHTANEWVSIPSLERLVESFKAIIEKLTL